MAASPLEDILEPVLSGQVGFVTNNALRDYAREKGVDYDRLSRSGAVTGVMRKLRFRRGKLSGERGFRNDKDTARRVISLPKAEEKAQKEREYYERMDQLKEAAQREAAAEPLVN
jgi:hypothetical protein